jgi:putative nucleotidyltransferase with HDIG domain
VGSLKAAACMPMRVNQETIGILWIGKHDPFTPRDLHLLAAVADIAANAIYRATLHEQTQLRLQRLSALQAIDMAVSSSLDVRVTMTILLDQVTLQLGIAAADILLLNPHTQTLDFAAGRGFYSHLIQNTSLRIGQGYAGQAALDRQIVSVENLNESRDSFSRNQFLLGEGFTSYTAIPLLAKGQVKGVLELFYRTPFRVDAEWLDFLQSLGANAAIAIDNAELFDKLQRSNVELSLAYDATIEGWSRALELRDRETEGHTQRVADMTVKLARLVGVPDSELVHMRRGALLHDIGKMAIPDPILLKTGPLTESEWEIMQKHPVYAYQLLSPIPYLRPALDIPYYHHEKWDGTGYPNGLKGEQIPLAARVFAIIDVWDALRSDRPYRPALSYERSLEYIRSHTGINFDPQVVIAFLRMLVEE